MKSGADFIVALRADGCTIRRQREAPMKKTARSRSYPRLRSPSALVRLDAGAQKTAAPATPTAAMKPKKPVYVQDFVGSYEPAQSSQGRSGPLSRIRGARAGQKASQSAAQLSADIVKEFTAAGIHGQAPRARRDAADRRLARARHVLRDGLGRQHHSDGAARRRAEAEHATHRERREPVEGPERAVHRLRQGRGAEGPGRAGRLESLRRRRQVRHQHRSSRRPTSRSSPRKSSRRS